MGLQSDSTLLLSLCLCQAGDPIPRLTPKVDQDVTQQQKLPSAQQLPNTGGADNSVVMSFEKTIEGMGW